MGQKGLLIILSGPSGAGKGTIVELLMKKCKNLRHSVSVTTRKPRAGEREGIDYFFRSKEEFAVMVSEAELLEWVQYCGNFYGTPANYVEKMANDDYDVIFEIDVRGAASIKEKYKDSISIFLIPPSFNELRDRIEKRGTEKSEIIEARLETAESEIACADRYDYIVINDNAENAAQAIINIISAEKSGYEHNMDNTSRPGARGGEPE